MMIFCITASFLLIFAFGCHCPGLRPESTTGTGQTAEAPRAAIHQNFSYVEGVVDSVLAAEEERFDLLVTLTSVRAGSGGLSLLEAGSQIAVSPDLASDSQGTLAAFRQAKRGEKFSGSIIRAQDGRWILRDAHARQ